MAYQHFRAGEFLKLLAGSVVASIVLVILDYQFGIPLYLLAVACIVILMGTVACLALISKPKPSRRDLFSSTVENCAQERELIARLKTQAGTDPEHRDHALRTIREIESRIETRGAELEAIASMGQWQPPRAALSRSKRILVVVAIGCLALFAVAHVLEKPKGAVGFFSFGALSLWLAQHWYFTKQPIYRRWGANIEYEKDPSAHTSAVLASCLLGIFFIIGAYALL